MTVPNLQHLPWDSDFLGYPVAQMVVPYADTAALQSAIAQAWEQGFKLVYLLLDPAHAEAAIAARHAGAILVDRKVTLQYPIGPAGQSTAPTYRAIARVQNHSIELEKLAWESGEYSRFRVDPNFAPGVFEELYSHWLRASLSGERARAVFASLSLEGNPRGLLTLQQHGSVATIGLLAVHAAARGQGQGRALIEAAQQAAQEWGCDVLRVTTQLDNEPACRLYSRCGFLVEQVVHVYHLWRQVPGG